MKKLFAVLTVLILVFTACSNQKPLKETENPISRPDETAEKEFSIHDIDTSSYDEIEDLGFMYVLTKTEGTRMGLVHDENYFSFLSEVPDKKIWFLLKNGMFIDEEPFEDFFYYGGGNINAPEKHYIAACRDGSRYDFEVNENTLEVEGEGVSPALSVKTFDLTLDTYYWIARFPSHGVTAADGAVICEPHYGRLSIPFSDRILAADKASDMWSDSHCIIFDEKGYVIISSYNHIRFSVLYEGYIGVAYCADPETTYEYEFYQCNDSDGNPMPGGYWLIDKDGNPISERFDYLYIEKEWQLFATSPDNIIHAFTENGEEITFPVKDILIK